MEKEIMFTEIEDSNPIVINNKEIFADMVHRWGQGPVEGGVFIEIRSSIAGNTEIRTPLIDIPSTRFRILEGCKVMGSVACSDLFRWASEIQQKLPTPPPELAEDFDAYFSTSEFYDWLIETYESEGSKEPRYFQAESYPTLPAEGFIFFRHTDVFFQLVIPRAVKMEQRQIRLLLLKGDEDFDRISCTDLLGNVEIFQFPVNGEEALKELKEELVTVLKQNSLSFMKFHEEFESLMELGSIHDIFTDQMDNYRGDIDWSDVCDDLGIDFNELTSSFIQAIIHRDKNFIHLPPTLNENCMIETAEKHFNLSIESVVDEAIDNMQPEDILALADHLGWTLTTPKRAAIEKL